MLFFVNSDTKNWTVLKELQKKIFWRIYQLAGIISYPIPANPPDFHRRLQFFIALSWFPPGVKILPIYDNLPQVFPF